MLGDWKALSKEGRTGITKEDQRGHWMDQLKVAEWTDNWMVSL